MVKWTKNVCDIFILNWIWLKKMLIINNIGLGFKLINLFYSKDSTPLDLKKKFIMPTKAIC